jgi:hypothetical protein
MRRWKISRQTNRETYRETYREIVSFLSARFPSKFVLGKLQPAAPFLDYPWTQWLISKVGTLAASFQNKHVTLLHNNFTPSKRLLPCRREGLLWRWDCLQTVHLWPFSSALVRTKYQNTAHSSRLLSRPPVCVLSHSSQTALRLAFRASAPRGGLQILEGIPTA